MQPGTIGTKKDLTGPGSFESHFQQIVTTYAGGIGINIRMPFQQGYERNLRPPVIGKAGKMGNDES